MTLLKHFMDAPLVGAIGWTLLDSLWEGAVVAAVLAAVLLPVRAARVRYGAACVAMLAMLGGFGFTLWRVMPESGQAQIVSPSQVTGTGAGTAAPIPSAPAMAAIAPWLTPLWILGVLVFCVRQAGGYVVLSRLRRQGVCAAPARWLRELARLRTRLGLSRPVALMESCLAEAPMVLGHFRPLILMPAGLLTGLPAGQIEAVLLHELAHVRRHDYLVNTVGRVVEALLFYHPATWWISRVIRVERENCCDDVVVSVRGDAQEYARALAALEEYRWQGGEPAVAATGGDLVTRIRRLLYPQSQVGWAPLVAAGVLITALAVSLAAWQSDGAEKATPYLKWLNEDAAYIIQPAERAAYLRLTTDDERNQFIEQFWERRNPTPGSPENGFKQEHYRRIGYANMHFSSGRPGWKADRGHIYIVYGPPDEIDAHPASRASPGHEEWLYRYVEGKGNNVIFRFEDRTGSGDYGLVGR